MKPLHKTQSYTSSDILIVSVPKTLPVTKSAPVLASPLYDSSCSLIVPEALVAAAPSPASPLYDSSCSLLAAVPALAPESTLQDNDPVSYIDNVYVLYNKIILNSSLLELINEMKSDGFTTLSIPRLIIAITVAYNSYTASIPAHKLSIDDLEVLFQRLYIYLVEKYNLIDGPDRLAMYNLFNEILKICLPKPKAVKLNVKKEETSCFNLFKCRGSK